jgi:hypothetical protein
MTEPAQGALKTLESDLDAAIALCDGDVRGTTCSAGLNQLLERELGTVGAMVSAGYARHKISPARGASKKLDDWRELSSNVKPKERT